MYMILSHSISTVPNKLTLSPNVSDFAEVKYTERTNFSQNWLRIHNVMGHSKWLNSIASEA